MGYFGLRGGKLLLELLITLEGLEDCFGGQFGLVVDLCGWVEIVRLVEGALRRRIENGALDGFVLVFPVMR